MSDPRVPRSKTNHLFGASRATSSLHREGRKAEKGQRGFLYPGISARPFKRQFNLADYVQVKGAAFDNGLLQTEPVREVPEAMKPRRKLIRAAPERVFRNPRSKRWRPVSDRLHVSDNP
jgi:hypothetical protein